MTTENPDLVAESEYLTNHLIDLARAAYWAREMKQEQQFLNIALDGPLDGFGEFEELMTVDEAVARLREEAISDYMNGVDEDVAEVSARVERANRAVFTLETIATRADHLRSYAEYALNLIEPPAQVVRGEWDAKKAPAEQAEGGAQ